MGKTVHSVVCILPQLKHKETRPSKARPSGNLLACSPRGLSLLRVAAPVPAATEVTVA